MPDPASLSIIRAVTGLIGGITGIAGLVVGYIGYRRSQQIKALDLRLELRKQVSDLRATGAASRRKEEARSRSSKGQRSKVQGQRYVPRSHDGTRPCNVNRMARVA